MVTLTPIKIEKKDKTTNKAELSDTDFAFAYILTEMKFSLDRLTEAINVLTGRLTRR